MVKNIYINEIKVVRENINKKIIKNNKKDLT